MISPFCRYVSHKYSGFYSLQFYQYDWRFFHVGIEFLYILLSTDELMYCIAYKFNIY